jgi:hypothetical protein
MRTTRRNDIADRLREGRPQKPSKHAMGVYEDLQGASRTNLVGQPRAGVRCLTAEPDRSGGLAGAQVFPLGPR